MKYQKYINKLKRVKLSSGLIIETLSPEKIIEKKDWIKIGEPISRLDTSEMKKGDSFILKVGRKMVRIVK